MKKKIIDILLRKLMKKVCQNVSPPVINSEHNYRLSKTHPMPYANSLYNYQLDFLINKTNGLYVNILKYNHNTKEYIEVFKYENDDYFFLKIYNLKETIDVLKSCTNPKKQGLYISRINNS